MARSDVILEARMDGGTEHRVVVDQRDFARWEAQPFRDEEALHTRLRFLTWSAMTRQGLTTAAWPEFNERLLVDTGVPDDDEDEDEEGEQGLDPGHRPTSGTPSSTSPSPQGSRSRDRAASNSGTRAT
jgi:hypothetical protein